MGGGPMSMAINSFWHQEPPASQPAGNTYVAEDGTTPYTTEDGSQNYVPES